MQKKVTVIGAGAVGSTTAFALLTRGAASEVVLIDVNTDKALGEALDINQATPFIDNCEIHAGTYVDAVGSDVVIIRAFPSFFSASSTGTEVSHSDSSSSSASPSLYFPEQIYFRNISQVSSTVAL